MCFFLINLFKGIKSFLRNRPHSSSSQKHDQRKNGRFWDFTKVILRINESRIYLVINSPFLVIFAPNFMKDCLFSVCPSISRLFGPCSSTFFLLHPGVFLHKIHRFYTHSEVFFNPREGVEWVFRIPTYFRSPPPWNSKSLIVSIPISCNRGYPLWENSIDLSWPITSVQNACLKNIFFFTLSMIITIVISLFQTQVPTNQLVSIGLYIVFNISI